MCVQSPVVFFQCYRIYDTERWHINSSLVFFSHYLYRALVVMVLTSVTSLFPCKAQKGHFFRVLDLAVYFRVLDLAIYQTLKFCHWFPRTDIGIGKVHFA